MEELKQMLKAIHEENKDIIFLLCSNGETDTKDLLKIANEIDQRYDCIFYGKELDEKTNE
jgi:hypothetical protein